MPSTLPMPRYWFPEYSLHDLECHWSAMMDSLKLFVPHDYSKIRELDEPEDYRPLEVAAYMIEQIF